MQVLRVLSLQVWAARGLRESGALCEYVVLPASHVCRRPPHLLKDIAGAAAIPFSALVAAEAVGRDVGRRVFISDATTPAGIMVLQLLCAQISSSSVEMPASATVMACAPSRFAPLAAKIGGCGAKIISVGSVGNEKMNDVTEVEVEVQCSEALHGQPPFDQVIVTGDLLSLDFCRSWGGDVIHTSAMAAAQSLNGANSLARVLRTLWPPNLPGESLNHSGLKHLTEAAEAGRLRPIVNSVVPLQLVVDTVERLAAGDDEKLVGKIVILISEESTIKLYKKSYSGNMT